MFRDFKITTINPYNTDRNTNIKYWIFKINFTCMLKSILWLSLLSSPRRLYPFYETWWQGVAMDQGTTTRNSSSVLYFGADSCPRTASVQILLMHLALVEACNQQCLAP